MIDQSSYRVFPLGDSAITLDFGNVVDEKINRKVIDLFHSLNKEPLPGMTEIVPAYSSLTVYYDVFQLRKLISPDKTVCEWMMNQLEKRLELPLPENNSLPRVVKIPVCYEEELALDIKEIASAKNITIDEVIKMHTSKAYRVYMLGFLPGFAYMGEVDKQIEMPRKLQPRQRVEAGSVGIAGRQTGIYPLASPGGWQIIGCTPLKLFDAKKEKPTFFEIGDTVQFFSISKDEFENY
jgi:inhibitor of KinA